MRQYTLSEVNFALADIKETLALWIGEPVDNPYVVKLLKEWDEMLDRKRELSK